MKDNTLFKDSRMDSYIKKYKKEFKLTNAQKEAVIKWNKKLKDGELKKEESNYINFAITILVNLLGYDPDEDFDQEVKMGRGFADFVIKKDGKNFIVGELKGSNADLEKRQAGRLGEMSAVEQGFFYANKEGIKWIIVSNYNEFRLYNRNIGEDKFIKFKIDELKDDHEKLKLFLLTFSKFSTLEKKLIDKLASKTKFVDRDFENEFYKLYNETRLMLIAEIEHIHPEFSRNKSVHYAQLILNRYIFICFAEDMGLLPDEISVESIENPVKTDNLGRSEIWHRLNGLFLDVDKGNPFRKEKIFGYNGGLFLENIEFLKIRDIVEDHSIFVDTYQKWKFEEYYSIVEEKLSPFSNIINPIYKNLMTISTFNFKSEVDVNILGHIFENSIGDIEELKLDSKGRKKQDGIFYTPNYITDYICRRTIIPYLSQKDSETVEDLIIEYIHIGKIDELENNLMNIKIIDIACGSGAFLNKASDILLEIHNGIYDYRKKIERVTIKTKGGKGKYKIKTEAEHSKLDSFFDKAKNRRKILKNNIYGVDLNDESVEITKLGLFLKIAQKDKKLPYIDKNIKCGNSLIDDEEYTNKPFNWEKRFSDILKEGGFDIIIGNPPYIQMQKTPIEVRKFCKNHYKETYASQNDIWYYFIVKGLNLLKKNGKLGFIVSRYFMEATYAKKTRRYILDHCIINQIIDFNNVAIFKGVGTHTSILILEKDLENFNEQIAVCKIKKWNSKNKELLKKIIQNFNKEEYEDEFVQIFHQNQLLLQNGSWALTPPKTQKLISKLNKNKKLGNIVDITNGIKSGANPIFEINREKVEECHIEKSILRPLIKNSDIRRYLVDYKDKYIIYTTEDTIIDKYPNLESYLSNFKSDLIEKQEARDEDGEWFELYRPRSFMFNSDIMKLVCPYRAKELRFFYNDQGFCSSTDTYALKLKEDKLEFNLKALMAILNSKLLLFYYKIEGKKKGDILEVGTDTLTNLPIAKFDNETKNLLTKKADLIIQYNKYLQNEINGFHKWFKREFSLKISTFTKDYLYYYELGFEKFLKQVKSKKADLKSRKREEYLEKEFNESLDTINELLDHIDIIDDEIDLMVYELYDLTEDEIDIIEDSLKN
jgi:hypothetical protein